MKPFIQTLIVLTCSGVFGFGLSHYLDSKATEQASKPLGEQDSEIIAYIEGAPLAKCNDLASGKIIYVYKTSLAVTDN